MKHRSERAKNLAERLHRAGFQEKTAAVYATLLDLGGAYPSRVARETGINRSSVYKILVDLSVKGLVGEVEKKHKLFYQLERPARLKRLMDMQVSLAEDNREAAIKLVPDIEELWAAHAGKPRVVYFEGVEEVRGIYEDHLSVDKPYEMLALYNASEITNVLSEEWLHSVYVKRKTKLGIKTRAVLPNTTDDRHFIQQAYRGVPRAFRPEVRYVPDDVFPAEAEITVYGARRVSIVDLTKIHPMGVIIDDETIYQTMRMVFDIVWRVARPDRRT
jgi:predicted DNA-binding transcriptional regulator